MGATTNVERAVSALRRMIFSGELPPGSDHLETELADTLGMSRTPVREAALILQAQGLVELRPRRGIRIEIRTSSCRE
ncbi:MAG: winged helix-turn-helix domain-containing protein, partial [Pseudomonadota bacterium]